MAKRFLDLRNRQIREGKLNKGFPGKDFSSQAFLSDRAIVVFGISKSQAQGELAVIEGKFNYPGSRATGSLSGYMSASVFTEEERNGSLRHCLPEGLRGGMQHRLDLMLKFQTCIHPLYPKTLPGSN